MTGSPFITDGRVTGAMRESPVLARSSVGPGTQAVDVFVHATFHHTDGSMDDGAQQWAYTVARSSSGGPWLIVDQGLG